MHFIRPSALLPIILATSTAAAPVNDLPSNQLSKRLLDEQYNSGSGTYTDGQGTYIGSADVHRYASGVKCWTDHYVVSQDLQYSDWQQASGKIYCTGTDSCSAAQMAGVQTCETWSTSINAGVSGEIFSFGVSAGYDLQKCNMAQDTKSCSWTDGQCHVVWVQQQLLSQKGYQRRRCDDGGDYTAWLKDFEHVVPTSKVNYGCGSKCSDSA